MIICLPTMLAFNSGWRCIEEFQQSAACTENELLEFATAAEEKLAQVEKELADPNKAFKEERKANAEALQKIKALKDCNKEIAHENFQLVSTLHNYLKFEVEKIEQLNAQI